MVDGVPPEFVERVTAGIGMVDADWYQQQLDPLTISDVVRTYYFHGPVGKVSIDNNRTEIRWINQVDGGWKVFLYHPDGTPILATVNVGLAGDTLLPLQVTLRTSERLRLNQGLGRVANLDLMCLTPQCQGHGIARLLLDRKEALFRKWQAKEFQLLAACAGLQKGIWLKSFKFEIWAAERVRLEGAWKKFQQGRLKRKSEDLRPLPTCWNDWPPDFVATLDDGQGGGGIRMARRVGP